jgi:hypothetical protein
MASDPSHRVVVIAGWDPTDTDHLSERDFLVVVGE